MKRHGRLPWFAPGDLNDGARALYERIAGGPRSQGPQAFPLVDDEGRLHGPFNAMLLSPEIGSALQELGSAIRYRSVLPARVREIAILELAVLRACAFEWYAHERVGKQSGLSGAEIAAIRDATAAPTFDGAETLTRSLVRRLATQRDLDDGEAAAAIAAFGERGLAELIALVGYYDLLALSLSVWRTPLPPGEESPFG